MPPQYSATGLPAHERVHHVTAASRGRREREARRARQTAELAVKFGSAKRLAPEAD